MSSILVTGATGNVGLPLLHELQALGLPFKAAVRDPQKATAQHGGFPWVPFDFEDPGTFPGALAGVDQVFLVLPPGQGSLERRMYPFLNQLALRDLRGLVYLSLLGAPQNPAAPHHQIEQRLQKLPFPSSFLRASFFMQNLSTTHREEVLQGKLLMPAGNGKTSFVDTRDIARAAARLFANPPGHTRGYDLTGSEALTYTEVASILSQEIGHEVVYQNPSVLEFVRHWKRQGAGFDRILIMLVIYTTARLGRAGRVSDDLAQLLGHPPTRFDQFARDHRSCWQMETALSQEKPDALHPH